MVAPIVEIRPILCIDASGYVVRMCFDVTMADKYGRYYVEDVPYPIGIKLRVGQMFNAPVEVGFDNEVGGVE